MVAQTALGVAEMKWLGKFLSVACFAMFSTVAGATPATVGYIIDGDTFSAQVNLADGVRISVRVRIIDIDTPEISGQCDREIEMALRARDRLAELLPAGADIELTDIRDDKYLGRIDAYVKTPDGRDVSKILLNEKLARPYNGGRRQPWCE